ncbi:helix-turn-helix domain-containing protein, partial [Klebsiella variicola]|uniref:helix-turn-helix domain-containing protein n=2 Tax=Pseudomonadota TaxID=1224 RepID=UPI002731E08A
STLSGLESAQGNPTIETLWAIANALDTPFGQLVSGTSLGPVHIGDGQVAVRFIERTDDESGSSIESYRMHLAAGYTKQS